jgi:hypothetical protein
MMDKEKNKQDDNILGLSTSELANLTADELTDNPTAIKMILHYYRQLVSDNNSLKNDNNTLKTYVSAYDKQKSNTATGAVLLSISNISIGFGVNLLSTNQFWPGLCSLLAGLALIAAGIYFSFIKDRG